MKTMKRRLENEAIPDGNKVRARNHVLLSDKSISDVVEALIGVHLANAGKVIIDKSCSDVFLLEQDTIKNFSSPIKNQKVFLFKFFKKKNIFLLHFMQLFRADATTFSPFFLPSKVAHNRPKCFFFQ